MGVDLKLLIVDGNWSGGGYSHTMLEIGRWYDLYPRLDKRARTLPELTKDFTSYVGTMSNGESGYGPVTETPYGCKITFVTAKEFLAAVQETNPPDWPAAKAAVAYVKELDPDRYIALYYH